MSVFKKERERGGWQCCKIEHEPKCLHIFEIYELLCNIALVFFSPTDEFDDPSHIDDHVEVELIFESYLLDISSVYNQTTPLIDRVSSTQSLLDTRLNASRNKLLSVEMVSRILSLFMAIIAATVGLFGMNLISGYENSHTAFVNVVTISVSASLCLIIGSVALLQKQGLFQV